MVQIFSIICPLKTVQHRFSFSLLVFFAFFVAPFKPSIHLVRCQMPDSPSHLYIIHFLGVASPAFLDSLVQTYLWQCADSVGAVRQLPKGYHFRSSPTHPKSLICPKFNHYNYIYCITLIPMSVNKIIFPCLAFIFITSQIGTSWEDGRSLCQTRLTIK